ncbi:hypothetical protein V1477_019494 [Vespula maculifrons]|uniref:Uncharacterized protein n=1 Tax=Vespula maculifrons TaxID=7453 RepID=A0ABD2AQL3_VESMC
MDEIKYPNYGFGCGLIEQSGKIGKKNFVGRKFPVLNENVLEEKNCEVLAALSRFFEKETWFTDIWGQRVIWRNPLDKVFSSRNDNYEEGWQQYMSRSRDVPSELGVDKSFVNTRRYLIDNIEHLLSSITNRERQFRYQEVKIG